MFKHTSTGATRNKNNGTCLGWLYRSHNWGYICCENHLTIAIASRTFTWQWNRPRQNHSKCVFSCYILEGTSQIYHEILKLAWQSHCFLSSAGPFFMDFSVSFASVPHPPEITTTPHYSTKKMLESHPKEWDIHQIPQLVQDSLRCTLHLDRPKTPYEVTRRRASSRASAFLTSCYVRNICCTS